MGERGWGKREPGASKRRGGRSTELQGAQRAQAADDGGPADRGHSPSPAAQGKPRAGAGHCGRPSRPLDPRSGLAGPGGCPAPPHPTPCPGGAARLPPGPALPPLGPRPAPARPPLPPQAPSAGPLPSPGGRGANRRPPPALPQPRCGPTGGLTGRVSRRRDARGRGGPGTDAPQREQRLPRAAGRRSAAPSRSGPAPHRGPWRGEGGSTGSRGAATSRRWQLLRTGSASDSRWRLPKLPPSDCPASLLAKLRPQPPAPDTAPSRAAARHLGPPRRPRLTREAANRGLELGAAGQSQGESERGWGEELRRCPGASWWPGRPRGCGAAGLRGWGGRRPESPHG